jgi:hypothetical protein
VSGCAAAVSVMATMRLLKSRRGRMVFIRLRYRKSLRETQVKALVGCGRDS